MSRHGLSKSPEYRAWQLMVQRCTNPKNPQFRLYGGRGIAICDEWLKSFESFIADLGKRPNAEYSLDRRDNNRGYDPSNVRWATKQQQVLNRRTCSRNRSGYRGVSWARHANKFASHISSYGYGIHLGLFTDPAEAALAYDCAAIQLYGDDAKLNILGGE